MKERVIQSRVKKFLENEGWLVWKLPPFIKGIPDTINLKNGYVFFIEFKKEDGGKLGIYQAKFILKLRKHGFIAEVIDNWETFMEVYNGITRTIQIPKGGSK